MPFNPLGMQPTIRDGVRGEGLVTKSAAGPDKLGMGQQPGDNNSFTGTFGHFSATTPMIVQVPGSAPRYVAPQRLASREKYAVVGMRLPLTLSPDLRRLRIEWDEVPTIDEMIARGERMFTDPDAVAAELEAAWADVAAHAGGNPPQRMARAPIDGPSARVMAVGHGATDNQSVVMGKRELLLSVSVPNQPRYGVRWRQRPPRNKIIIPGTDLPIHVDPSDPQKIEISWESLASSPWEFAARASSAPLRPVGVQPPAPPAPADPLDELKQLGQLRDAGALTDAEFAAEKARVLGQM